MAERTWFYADSNQQQQGPITFGEIQQLAAKGTIQPSTLIWKEGMAGWTAASEVQGVYGNSATQTPASPTQAIPSNPYEAPASANAIEVSSTGAYPIPTVKKCSFALFLGLLIRLSTRTSQLPRRFTKFCKPSANNHNGNTFPRRCLRYAHWCFYFISNNDLKLCVSLSRLAYPSAR